MDIRKNPSLDAAPMPELSTNLANPPQPRKGNAGFSQELDAAMSDKKKAPESATNNSKNTVPQRSSASESQARPQTDSPKAKTPSKVVVEKKIDPKTVVNEKTAEKDAVKTAPEKNEEATNEPKANRGRKVAKPDVTAPVISALGPQMELPVVKSEVSMEPKTNPLMQQVAAKPQLLNTQVSVAPQGLLNAQPPLSMQATQNVQPLTGIDAMISAQAMNTTPTVARGAIPARNLALSNLVTNAAALAAASELSLQSLNAVEMNGSPMSATSEEISLYNFAEPMAKSAPSVPESLVDLSIFASAKQPAAPVTPAMQQFGLNQASQMSNQMRNNIGVPQDISLSGVQRDVMPSLTELRSRNEIPTFGFDDVSMEIIPDARPNTLNSGLRAPMATNPIALQHPERLPNVALPQNPVTPAGDWQIPEEIVGNDLMSLSDRINPRQARMPKVSALDGRNQDLGATSASLDMTSQQTEDTSRQLTSLLTGPIVDSKGNLAVTGQIPKEMRLQPMVDPKATTQPWQQRQMEEKPLSRGGMGLESFMETTKTDLPGSSTPPTTTGKTGNTGSTNVSNTPTVAAPIDTRDQGRDAKDNSGQRDDRAADKTAIDNSAKSDLASTLVEKNPTLGAAKSANRAEAMNASSQATMQRVEDAALRLQAQGGGTAKIQLSDSRLGQMELQVRVGVGNNVHIEVKAKNEKIKSALEERVDDLKTSLNGHSLTLSEFKVVSDAAAARNDTDTRGGTQQGEQKFPSQSNGQQNGGNTADSNTNQRREISAQQAANDALQRKVQNREKETNIASKTNVQRNANGSLKVTA